MSPNGTEEDLNIRTLKLKKNNTMEKLTSSSNSNILRSESKKHSKTDTVHCISSSFPEQAEYAAIDFLHTANDDPVMELNEVDNVDVKPVTLIEFINVHNGKLRKKPYMALIDTGSAKSHLKATISQYGRPIKDRPNAFRTANGKFSPKLRSNLKFTLSEFSKARQIEHKLHVLPENSSLHIIGRDLLMELQMDVVKYSNNKVVWDDLRLPMNPVKNDARFINLNAFASLMRTMTLPISFKR